METIKIPWMSQEHEIITTAIEFEEYHAYAEYVNLVKSGEQIVGQDIHKLIHIIETHLFPMLDDGIVYMDYTLCESAIHIPKKYFPYDIFPWEKFLVPFIFGLRYYSDHTLVFDEYFMYMARGAGKNGWLSWVIFVLISKLNGIPKYDVAVSASSERQAKRSFLDIKEVLEITDPKQKAFYRTMTEIQSYATGSNFQYLSSNGKTADGLRLGALYLDEVHAIKDYSMLNVLKSSLGKVPDPRTFITTTDGYERGAVLDDYKDTSQQILLEELGFWYPPDDERHSRMLPFMHRIDNADEVKTVEGWHKANPTLKYNNFLLQQYRKEVIQIDRNAELNIEFHAKRVNFPKEDSRFALATHSEILATKNGKTLEQYVEESGVNEVVGCVDWSDTHDLTSCGLLLFDRMNDQYYFDQTTYMTQTTYSSGQINPQVLQNGINDKKLNLVYSKTIEEEIVVQYFLAMAEKYYIRTIFIDHFKSTVLKPALEKAGFTVEVTPFNSRAHTLISPVVDKIFTQERLHVGDDSLFRWSVANIYKLQLSNGIRYDKIEPKSRKTDPVSALITGLTGLIMEESELPDLVYAGKVIE